MTTAPILTPRGDQLKGQSLTTTSGTWSDCNGGFTYGYQWYWSTAPPPGGTQNVISGATLNHFTPNGYLGDYITVGVVACDYQQICGGADSQDGSGNTGYVYVYPTPSNTVAPTISPSGTGQNASGTVFTAAKGTWSSLLTISGYGYQWLRNGAAISGATSSTYTANCASDAGTTLTVKVDATNAEGTSGWVTSSNSAKFYPCNTVAPTVSPSGTGQTADGSQQFSAGHGTWAGSATSYTYQWLSNGSPATGVGATTATYTPSCSNDAGKTLTVEVKATNSYGTSGWKVSSNNAQFVPCNTAGPTISPSGAGQDANGAVFTAANGSWTGSPTSYGYQWLRNGAAITGATSSTYTADCSSDAGTTLTVEVKATNGNGTSGWTASNSAQFVPCNTAAPTLSPDGTGRSVGETLSADSGTWAAATSYSYAWLRDGSPINGATGSTYTTTTADLSHCISAKVTATNSYGSSSTTTSDSACVDNHLGTGSVYTFWSQPIDDREAMSVNVGNGNLSVSANDLQLAGMAGFDLHFARTYNSLYSASQDLATSNPANGWQTLASLDVASNGDVWYTDTSGAESAFLEQSDGSYAAPAGVDSQLVKNQDGSYTLTFDGSSEELNFNASGVLQSDVDANGNTITYSWSGGQLNQITDSLGHTTSFTYNGSGQLSTITDPGNRTYSYSYDSNGNLASFTDPTNATTNYGYDSSGRLNEITDPDGNMTQIAYDASGRVSTVTRGLNSLGSCPVGATCPVTSFLYAQPGGSFCSSPSTETDVTDPNMHTTGYCSDSQLRVTGTMDPLGYTTSTSYSSGGSNCADNQPCSATDANQNTTAYNYDQSTPQDLSKVTLTPFGGSASTQLTASYQAPSNNYLPSSSTDANSQQTSYAYNSSSNLTSQTDPGNAQASTAETTYTYDSQGRMLTQVSPDGNDAGCGCATSYTTQYSYYPSGSGNGAGLLQSVTNPVGDETTYSYDSLGRKVSVVDPNGNVSGGNPAAHTTTYTYDGNDRLLSVTDPLGHTTTYTYDGDGNRISATDGNGHTTTSTYDALNELTTTTKPDPDGSGPLSAPVISYAYDAAGNETSETDANNHTATYAYDADNRKISQTDALGNETTYTYDGNGNLLTTVDPRGNVAGCGCAAQYTTTNTYDDQGRLLTTKDPLGNLTTYTYDGDGNKKTVTDANNHQTTYSYYPSGLVQSVTAPDGGITSYTYDADGNALSRTDANNHTTTYTYSHADQLTSVTTPLGNETTYTYDADGNKTSMVDGNGNATGGDPAAHTTSYGYDAANQLTSISYGDGTTPNVTYSYDAAGNRTSMTDGAGTVNYSYDNDNQLLSSSRGSDTFTYTYDPAGNTTSRGYPGGTSASYDYNADEELETVTSGGNTTTYTYDPASELTQTDLPNGYVETRSYDNAGRVTEVNNANNGTVLSDYAYTLDPVGNPTKVVQTGAVSSTTLYQYDPNNRLTDACYQATACNESAGSNDPYIHYTYDEVGNRLSEQRPSGTTSYTYNADNELTQAGVISYTYDHNGNETQAGSRTFTYDLANRLISTSDSTNTTSYTYDGSGNRLTATTGGAATDYLWDTENTLPQLALERDGSGTVLRSYIYGIRRISMNSGGNPYYYLYDSLGSVVNVTSSTGATELTYSYEPFGAIRTQTQNDPNAPANSMEFAGALFDSGSGLYDLGAREYDTQGGRFVTQDPAARSADAPDLSSYAYADDAPTTLTDPSGMYVTCGQNGPCGDKGSPKVSQPHLDKALRKILAAGTAFLVKKGIAGAIGARVVEKSAPPPFVSQVIRESRLSSEATGAIAGIAGQALSDELSGARLSIGARIGRAALSGMAGAVGATAGGVAFGVCTGATVGVGTPVCAIGGIVVGGAVNWGSREVLSNLSKAFGWGGL